MGYLAVFLLFGMHLTTVTWAWKNSYHSPLMFMCPSNKVLNFVKSSHSNQREDRMWDLYCRPEVSETYCHWTGYVNDIRQLMVFQCPKCGYINGMNSYYRENTHDRRWRFYCCSKKGYHTANCRYTGWKNGYDKLLQLRVRKGFYIKGVISGYHNDFRDRVYRYQLCSLKKD